MHNCDSLDPLVTPFVDGELPDADRRSVEEHLRVCPPCHSRVAAEQAVQALMRSMRPSLCASAAPGGLRASCADLARRGDAAPAGDMRADHDVPPSRAAAPPVPPPRHAFVPAAPVLPRSRSSLANPASWPARVAPYALAASLVLVVGGAFVYQATDKSARVLAAELVADHTKCFALNGALGTQQMAAVVEQSMAASFDWRMHLPSDPALAGLELVGSRPCVYGQGRVAHIMYRHQGHPVSLFMLPRTARNEELVEVFGHEAAIWCANNRTFVLVAREPRADVQRMASFVQASLH